MRRAVNLSTLLCSLALLAPLEAEAVSVNIDFGSVFDGGGFPSGGTPPSASFGGADGHFGVWNNIVDFDTPSGVVSLDGSATGIAVSITAETLSGYESLPPGDANALMDDNFYSSSGAAWTFVVSGLPDGLYDVYLYDPHNPLVGTGSGSVNGASFPDINGNFGSGVFVSGSNFHRLENVVVTGGILSGSGASLTAGFSGLAGLQIVLVPEPAPVAMLWLSLAGLAAFRRRHRSARD